MKTGENKYFYWLIFCLALVTFKPFTSGDDRALSDDKITRAIKMQVQYDDKIDTEKLSIQTREGIVLLTGSVTNLLAKERVLQTVENTKGLYGFVDQLKVEPEYVLPDSILTLKIENHMVNDPVTESYEVGVKVINGKVTLEGVVDSLFEKKHAADVAKAVPGVREVDNDLSILHRPKRLDSQIKSEVRSGIKSDIRLDAYLLNIEVEQGNVVISGIVGSETARQRLESKAWVAGVKKVDTSRVEIKDWAQNKMLRDDKFIKVSNLELERRVNAALAYDSRVFSYDIEVEADSSFITLRGTLASKEARTAAGDDAKNIRGVMGVTNLIKVESYEAVPTNADLKKSVLKLLRNDQLADYSQVSVYASSGWVYLSGAVKTSFIKDRASKLIKSSIKGVSEVQNNLSYQYQPKVIGDWLLQADIKMQLENDPFINSSRINVSVDQGIATLNGKVQSFTEFSMAEEVAFRSGAKAVNNKLKVTFRDYSSTVLLN